MPWIFLGAGISMLFLELLQAERCCLKEDASLCSYNITCKGLLLYNGRVAVKLERQRSRKTLQARTDRMAEKQRTHI